MSKHYVIHKPEVHTMIMMMMMSEHLGDLELQFSYFNESMH